MRFALMIAGIFIIATVAVASLEPLAPHLPTAPADNGATPENQVADAGAGDGDGSGDQDVDSVDDEEYSNPPTASPGSYDEAAQDRGK